MAKECEKSWTEAKKELSETFYKVANMPEYVNKTFSGKKFLEALVDWRKAWKNLMSVTSINHPNDFNLKLYSWLLWNDFGDLVGEDFEFMCHSLLQEGNEVFPCPEFLFKMFELTHNFLCARTEEEESKILDVTYKIKKDENYNIEKYIWLTEEMIGVKSEELPRHVPYDLTDYARGKDLYNYLRSDPKEYNFINLKGIVDNYKDIWKCFKLAVKKGILIDKRGR